MIAPPPPYIPPFAAQVECIVNPLDNFLQNSSLTRNAISKPHETRTERDAHVYSFDFKDISSVVSSKADIDDHAELEEAIDHEWVFVAKPKKTITFQAKIVGYERGTPVVHFLELLEDGEF